MKKSVLLSTLSGLLAIAGFSQTANYWSANEASRINITKDKAATRATFPTAFKLFSLNMEPLKQALFAAVNNKSAAGTVVISLPNAAGGVEDFEVYEASNFEPALQARFPEIRAFSGRGITDKEASLKLSFSPQGIQTVVFRTEKDNEFIEPYSADHRVYAVFAAQPEKGNLPWSCKTPDQQMAINLNQQVAGSGITARSGGNLKTLRLALSVTGQYSNYFGATSAAQMGLVLAAVNATLAHCNGVYERDLAVHLNLVAASTNVFYYTPSTDPYTAYYSWNSQLQSTLTSVIGEANYDIGHLFTPAPEGGNAFCIGCICVDGSKGSAWSSTIDGVPKGNNFDCIVMHEMGHQMGANHTFSDTRESAGSNKEVASGITIMSYAGVGGPNVAGDRNDVYHEHSIAQIEANLATKTCPVTTTITNATPVVAAISNYTIPKSTPFALTGAATDANTGDVLTYCWEQNDNASQTGPNSVASPTKASGPNWLSFRPTTSPTRYCPQLATILAGGLVTGPLPGGSASANIEALSSVARTLNFRLTVRDNAPYRSTAPVSVGQTAYKDMVVTVDSTCGPFRVTAPDTATTWATYSAQTITWDVANSTAPPVSCAHVKISLSTDSGKTFPTVLSASTPNDGSFGFTVPNMPATTGARIKVEAIGNIFFDISNKNFRIVTGIPVCNPPTELTVSAITNSSFTLTWLASYGAVSYDVDYKPASATTWTNVFTRLANTGISVNMLNPSTTYDWRIRTNCTGTYSATSPYATIRFTTAPAPACFTFYEPNETIGTAKTLVSGLSSMAAIGSATDVDYYKIDVSTTSDLIYTLTVPIDVNYDLYVYNSAGVQLASGTNGGNTTESISLNNLTQGTYYIKVIGVNGSNISNCYTIRATARPSASCQSSYDASTNGTTSGAAAIPFNTNVTGLINPSSDYDNYKFVVSTGGTITLTLTGLAADYDLKLLNSAGTQVGSSDNYGTTAETINYTAPAGTYYAQVYGYNGATNATTCYTLKVQTGTAARSITEVPEAAIVSGKSAKGNAVSTELAKTGVVSTEPTKAGVASIYPNPVSTELKINMGNNREPLVATLTDLYGRRIVSQAFTGVTSIATAKLAAGVYTIAITNKSGVLIKQDKIVKE